MIDFTDLVVKDLRKWLWRNFSASVGLMKRRKGLEILLNRLGTLYHALTIG